MPDPVELDAMETDALPENIETFSRKRKRDRRRKLPFKDLTLTINVKANVKTASSTQRHLHSKDDSVSQANCLSDLSRKFFDSPSHSICSESMARQFQSRSMSHKLLQSFRRMTLTKSEETNRDMVQECFVNRRRDGQDDNEPTVYAMPSVENSLAGSFQNLEPEAELSGHTADLSAVPEME